MLHWFQLTKEARDYINQRFSQYGISGLDAYNSTTLFPEKVKNLESDEIIELLKSKDISHIKPVSDYPEYSSDLNNIILEDPIYNRSRGAEIIGENELNLAEEDLYSDISDFENNLDLFDQLPEILIGSSVFGLGLTVYETYDKIQKGEIIMSEVPQYFAIKSGTRVIKCAAIGICATSGSPILVAGSFGYILFKSRNLITTTFKHAWRIINHEKTKDLANQAIFLGAKTGQKTWELLTDEKTIDGASQALNIAEKGLKKTAQGTWNLVTHETTKNVAKTTLKITGKAAKLGSNGILKTIKWGWKKIR